QDREPFSPSYGSFDRTWWAWKFTDFPAARFQEALLTLADRLTRPLHAPPHGEPAGDARLLAWIEAGLRFWHRIQYGDGSFDEAYPFERSLAATAFTGFYVGEAFLLAREALGAGTRSEAIATFARAGDWLTK